ncbi:Sec-independent protein translocase subunit TatA/TatB [Collinsella vaginalis]|uniref:Sec-independent protein translocase subunit TatA/TatB n=1 Tax=Collinsella vaginalis TaxID=1870987 RepID=UPI000A26B582|nr:twin-arginine translocase TatA/TatE family subunit [Collinsella vaginalis]
MFPKGFEWVAIIIVALLIFGPKNLPKLGKSLGATVKNLREGMSSEDDKANTQDVEAETVIEDSDDAEIRELEAKLAAAKQKKEEADSPISND